MAVCLFDKAGCSSGDESDAVEMVCCWEKTTLVCAGVGVSTVDTAISGGAGAVAS